MSVNVSIVRPRSASVCHHEARRVDREVAQAVASHDRAARPRRRPPSAARAARARRRSARGSTPSAAASRGHSRRQRKTSPLTMLRASFAAAGVVAAHTQVVGEQARVGDVGDRLPLLLASPGSGSGRPVSRQIARVDRERHAHVHGVAERPADHGVRAVHRPGEAVALRRREQDVLLHVVEVLVRQARLLLGERRVRLRLGVRLERAEVVLEAGDQRDVADRLLRRRRASSRLLQHARR